MNGYEDFYIGSTPSDEDCVHVSSTEDYVPAMRALCALCTAALEHYYAAVQPPGAYFKRQSNPHDLGTYYDVVVMCAYEDTDALLFALYVESQTPSTWAELGNHTVSTHDYCAWCVEHMRDMEDQLTDEPRFTDEQITEWALRFYEQTRTTPLIDSINEDSK